MTEEARARPLARRLGRPRPCAVGVAWAAVGGLLLACEAPERPPRSPSPDVGERSVREVEWSVTFEVRGSLQDTTLLGVAAIAADREGVSVVDPLRSRVLRFGTDGRLRWGFGRRGSGPGEFERPIHVALDRAGRTWVLDDRAMRVTVIDEAGRPAFAIPLGDLGGPPNGLVPLPGDELLLALVTPDDPLVRVDREGAVRERGSLRVGDLAAADPIGSQFVMAGLRGSDRWVAAFSFGDGFLAFDGLGPLSYRGRFVESVPSPAVVSRSSRVGDVRRSEIVLEPSVQAALAATLSAERLYVLFGGATEDRGRLVDVYEHATGRYVESLRLPHRGFRIALGGDVLYLAYADPFPSVIGLRPRSGTTAAPTRPEGGGR